MTGRLFAGVVACVAVACGAGAIGCATPVPPRAAPGAASVALPVAVATLDWEIRLDAAGVLHERICPAVDVAPVDPRARGFVRGDRVVGACRELQIDLAGAAAALDDRRAAARVSERVLVASPDVWLWTTRPLRGGTLRVAPSSRPIHVPFAVEGDGVGATGRLRVDVSTWRFLSSAVFGEVDARVVAVAGARLRVLTLPGPLQMVRADVDRWLGAAADAVATGHGGRFPVDDVLVVVEPVLGSGVPFGMVTRGGGPQANLLLGEQARVDDVVSDWVAVHELAHLLTPAFGVDDAWLSEGLASYWQNVLRARSGLLDEAEAWRLLLDGFERGAATAAGWPKRSLLDASRQMRTEGRWFQVYWGGAAVALMLDARLRACTGGSLDELVATLRRDHPGADGQRLPAAMVVARAAELARGPTQPRQVDAAIDRCDDLQADVEAALASPFPELGPLLAALGLAARGGAFDDGAPRAALRRAITRGPPHLRAAER